MQTPQRPPPTLHVMPVPGRLVRLGGLPLPAGGAQVPDTTYWHRRLAEGDVSLVQPPVQTPDPTPDQPASRLAARLARQTRSAA